MIKFLVYGSNASDRIFNNDINNNYEKDFKVVCSIGSSTLISLMSESIEFDKELVDSSNNYFNICVENDLSKDSLNVLKENNVDYLVMDTYFDATCPIIILDENKYISCSTCLEDTSYYNQVKQCKTINMKDNFDEYFSLYTKSCDKFFKFIETNCPDLKVIINCARSVYKFEYEGDVLENSHFKNLSYLNEYRNKLEGYILENYDVDVLPFDSNTLYVEMEHYGKHHTYYEPKYYEEKINQLKNIVKKNKLYKRDNVINVNFRKKQRNSVISGWNIKKLKNDKKPVSKKSKKRKSKKRKH